LWADDEVADTVQSCQEGLRSNFVDFSVSEEKTFFQVPASGYLYMEMRTQVRFVGNLAQQQNATDQLINFPFDWIQ